MGRNQISSLSLTEYFALADNLPLIEEFEDWELAEEDVCEPEECDCEEESSCDCETVYDDDEEEELEENRFVFRVTSRGQKIKKLRCKPGFRAASVGGRLRCVRTSGKEKMQKKRAVRKAVRTKKAKGSGYKKRIIFKQKRAIRKRKAMGLKNQKR